MLAANEIFGPETPCKVLFLALVLDLMHLLFQNSGTTIQMFKFGCELLFSSLHTNKCRPNFGIYLHSLVLSFLFVEVVQMVRVCAISF